MIQEIETMSAIRMLFIVMAVVIGVGIWLSGYDQVHWLLYIPPVALLFAGITGICPGYMLFSKLGFKGGGKL
jgi:ABC-type polysaccharide/polyol phosphate export permease